MTCIFKARNTVKTWHLSWCSAVIYRKHWQSAFELKFRLIVFLFFLKTWVKDHGNSFSRLLEKRIWIVCIEALWLAAFETFSCALTNKRIILKPGDRIFKYDLWVWRLSITCEALNKGYNSLIFCLKFRVTEWESLIIQLVSVEIYLLDSVIHLLNNLGLIRNVNLRSNSTWCNPCFFSS